VALKGQSIPRVAALVEAMFVAELKNLLLTAGHDLDVVRPPVRLDVAVGTERYVRIGGQEQELKAGDMFIADAGGILSSIIYGPDRRTQITPATRRVLFTVYAPPGIEQQAVYDHLHDIEANVRLIASQAVTELLRVYGAA
jgi:DNA/RNA-binding domain of Phe-tRNA-synthetase-like protein